MAKLCTTCNKMLATSQTLKKHAREFHRGDPAIEHDRIPNYPILNLDKQRNSASMSDEDDSASSDHDDDNNDDGSSNDDSNDSYDGIHIQSDEEAAWKEVITHVMGTHNIKNISEVTNERKFPKFIQEVRKEMGRRFKLCKAVTRFAGPTIYPNIKKTIDQLRKKGYGNREANVIAWRKRRFLIRQFIQKYMKMDSGENPESDEQDSSIDDEDSSSEEEDIEELPYEDI